MLLFYIRHGDPIYNPDSLTPLGTRQAEAVGRRLAMHGLDKIYASTSERAILTAKPAAEITKREIVMLDFCNERYAWDEFVTFNEKGEKDWVWRYPKTAAILLSPEITALGDKWYEHPSLKDTKCREGMERVNRESDAFLLSLGYKHIREKRLYEPVAPTNDRIALFAHQGFSQAFLSSILDIPYPLFATHFDMTPSAFTAIEFKERDKKVIPRVLTLSNDSHIYRDALPTKYQNTLYF